MWRLRLWWLRMRRLWRMWRMWLRRRRRRPSNGRLRMRWRLLVERSPRFSQHELCHVAQHKADDGCQARYEQAKRGQLESKYGQLKLRHDSDAEAYWPGHATTTNSNTPTNTLSSEHTPAVESIRSAVESIRRAAQSIRPAVGSVCPAIEPAHQVSRGSPAAAATAAQASR